MLGTLVGLFDLQVLLGVALVAGGRRPPGVWVHLAWMAAAAVVLHLTSARQRRRGARAGYGAPLLGVALALVLTLMGIVALGRAPL